MVAYDPRSQISELNAASGKMKKITGEAWRCCDQLSKRARELESLTSPASTGTYSQLSRANNNLAAALVLVKDARDKFDTVNDCEPSIERLNRGVMDLEEQRSQPGRKKPMRGRIALTEQDVYAAGDNMEILRDAYEFFMEKEHWTSSPDAVGGLERLHKLGLDSMCMLITSHLMSAGQAVRPKRGAKRDSSGNRETAMETRDRLSAALKNRDLLRSIGDYEEYQPVESRQIREIRAIFECIGCYGYNLAIPTPEEPLGLTAVFNVPPSRVMRTEKVGSGCFTNLTRRPLKTGFPQLDAYGEARKNVAFSSIDSYYRRIKQDRKKRNEKNSAGGNTSQFDLDEANVAARDAVRCIEHAMVVVAGEKSVFRSVVAPLVSTGSDEDDETQPLALYIKKASVAAYSHSVTSVVDRALDIIETVFLKEGGIGHSSGVKGGEAPLTVRAASSAAAAGLRMLDGVRMLGPSLAKLCEMPIGEDKDKNSSTSIAAVLCIAIHRTTVKNAARTLENLAKSIQDDPLQGTSHRPMNATVSSVTVDTIRGIKMVSEFTSAYKSVSKRRALPWDPNLGEGAGELDSFVRFLIMRLLNSLKGKALSFVKEERDDSQAKSSLFMINNCYYLLKQLSATPASKSGEENVGDNYRIEAPWFPEKVHKIIESEKAKYCSQWDVLNSHLSAIGKDEIEVKSENAVLSLESGRILKSRFNGFNEDFERTYALHKGLCVIDQNLRRSLQDGVLHIFHKRYDRFYNKYKKVRFSKRKQEEYLKFPPQTIENMIRQIFQVTK